MLRVLFALLLAVAYATEEFEVLSGVKISWVNTDDYIDLTFHLRGDICASWAPSVHGMSGQGVTGYYGSGTNTLCVDFGSYDTDIQPILQRSSLVGHSAPVNGVSTVTCRLPKHLFAIRDGPQRVITSTSAFNMERRRSMPHVENDPEKREVYTVDVVAGTLTSYTYNNLFFIPLIIFVVVVLLAGIISRLCGIVLTPRQLLAARVFFTLLLFAFVATYSMLYGLPYPTLTSVMFAFGEGTMLLAGLVMFPIAKFVSIALWTYGTSYERMLPWHVLLGALLVLMGLTHGVLAFVVIGIQEPDGLKFFRRGWLQRGNVYPVAGLISLVFLLALAIPAFLRQFAYTFFRYSHALIVLFIIFGILHYRLVGVAVAPALALYFLDVVWRFVPTIRHGTSVVRSANVKGDVVELRIAAPWSRVGAGQYALLSRADKCSKLTPHPFTIAHFNEDTHEATFYIKRNGAWTTDLLTGAEEGSVRRVLCQGPYGTLMVPVKKCCRVVLFAGGIGVTPMFSIAGSALQAEKPMRFVWVVRDANAIAQVAPLLRQLSIASAEAVVELYVTSREPIALEELGLGTVNVIKQRPNIPDIIQKEGASCGSSGPLGVYTCGPVPLMSSVESAASAQSNCLLHMETFEF